MKSVRNGVRKYSFTVYLSAPVIVIALVVILSLFRETGLLVVIAFFAGAFLSKRLTGVLDALRELWSTIWGVDDDPHHASRRPR